MTRMQRTINLGLASALVALSACTSATAPQENDLAAARQLWAISNVRSYEYTVSHWCVECSPESQKAVTISVSDGGVTARVYAATGQPASGSATDFTTIDALFDRVDTAIAQDAYRVDASYDPATGVPLRIFIDQSLQGIDDEYGFTVSNFRAR